MSEPDRGDIIRARRYGNRTPRRYVIDKLADGSSSRSFVAFCHSYDSKSAEPRPELMVFDRTDLRIIPLPVQGA